MTDGRHWSGARFPLRDVAVPTADLVTPNHFELDLLSGRTTATLPEVEDAVAAVQALGPRVVLTTSLVTDEVPVVMGGSLLRRGAPAQWHSRSAA